MCVCIFRNIFSLYIRHIALWEVRYCGISSHVWHCHTTGPPHIDVAKHKTNYKYAAHSVEMRYFKKAPVTKKPHPHTQQNVLKWNIKILIYFKRNVPYGEWNKNVLRTTCAFFLQLFYKRKVCVIALWHYILKSTPTIQSRK